MPVAMTTTDERSATLPVESTSIDLEEFGTWCKQAGEDGYSVKAVSAITGGRQRDPYTVAVKIVVAK